MRSFHVFCEGARVYLLVDAGRFRIGPACIPQQETFKPLTVHAARHVLSTIAGRESGLLAELYRDFSGVPGTPPRSHHAALEQLLHALGRDSMTGPYGLPAFARFYVLERERTSLPLPAPWDPFKEQRETIRAAEQAPRGYIVVETVNENGEPVTGVRLEFLLADGDVRSAITNSDGLVRLEPIPQGQCHIRLPDIDGSAWWPEGKAASSAVDLGRKRTHVVKQGECLSRIAHRYGIKNWKKIWEAPENEKLRKKRKNPNILLPGDEVSVPGIAVHEVVRETNATHRIVLGAEAKVLVRLLLLDPKRQPIGDVACEILINDEVYFTGKTKDGRLECELPVTAPEALLIAHTEKYDIERVLKIGALDPADHVSGAQARLLNLGFYSGEVDGQTSYLLMAAADEFRAYRGLADSSVLDATLFSELAKEHLV